MLIFVCISQIHSEVNKTIGIFTCKIDGVGYWDPDSIQNGIAGSEEAVIYLSNHLAKLGYQVSVYGNPPPNSRYSNYNSNPKYLDVELFGDKDLDIAISWRMPTIGSILKKYAKYVFFWPHDTIHYRLTAEQINSFDDVLWLSEWQRQQWISLNPEFRKFKYIYGNGIEPNQFEPVQVKKNPHSCIYASNYARGLEILLDYWPVIKKEFPEATLDIYYGWQTWGLLGPEKEAKMRRQIQDYQDLCVVDHQCVGHQELNAAFAKASIWAYPCIAPETFCITALRAQANGVIPVIIEGTALSETVRSGFKCHNPKEYLALILKALKEAEYYSLAERQQLSEFVFKEYTWEKIAIKWDQIFQSSWKEIDERTSRIEFSTSFRLAN